MSFRFSLDAVLRLRQGLEHQQEVLLREANHHITSLERQAEEVGAVLLADTKRERQELAAGMRAAELHFDLLCRSTLFERQRALEKHVLDARAERDVRAASFRQARQQREIIETLRRRHWEFYHQLEVRQQQREMDDLFLLLHNPARR
jgi:flagellar export protein FliJ